MYDERNEKAIKEFPEAYSQGYIRGRESYLKGYSTALMFKGGRYIENENKEALVDDRSARWIL